MSENYLYTAGLEHRITELEELLSEAATLLHHSLFVNFNDRKKADELIHRIEGSEI